MPEVTIPGGLALTLAALCGAALPTLVLVGTLGYLSGLSVFISHVTPKEGQK